MKLGTVLVLLASGAEAVSVEHAHNGRASAALFAGAEFGKPGRVAAPEDITKCSRVSHKFIVGTVSAQSAVEKAVDFCAVDKAVGDKTYVCPHFKEAVTAAFKDVDPSEGIDYKRFCEITEEYMLEMRGAARVPNIGAGPMTNFKISETCEMAVTGALAPKKDCSVDEVPDFWYSMCFNQDCAHFLPSRTRWCSINRAPTHSHKVCDGVRKFAKDESTLLMKLAGKEAVSPEKICSIYGEFVTETGIDIEAYEAVMLGDSVKYVPVPDAAVRALLGSRLTNQAGSHYLRDNEGSPVQPVEKLPHSGATKAGALLALALPLAAML
jgi:hypothetical protein